MFLQNYKRLQKNKNIFIDAQGELEEWDWILGLKVHEILTRTINWKFNCPSNLSSGEWPELLILIVKTCTEEVRKEQTSQSALT